jgi:sterol desaturase/sphingolipid hydroxylase (fatty acid hydroxylase superfamily)
VSPVNDEEPYIQAEMTEIFNFAEAYAGRIFLAATVIAVAELMLPQAVQQPWISRLRGGVFWVVYIIITATGMVFFGQLWSELGVAPAFHIDLSALSQNSNIWVSSVGGIVAMLIGIQFGEFFYYWFHRMQHEFGFLWRFHSVHHSLRDMNAFNSNHHFSEELLRIPFCTIPISLLFSFDQGHIPWIFATLMSWQGIYEHSATKIHFGPLRYLVPDNRFHRVHHSMEAKHFDHNFGSGSALWDLVFGTIYHPRNDEWPNVGLANVDEPKTVSEFLVMPFRWAEKEEASANRSD